MRINNNTAAYNTWTSYTKNQDNLKMSMSRLSTGIIAATDDPAGVGISERMRAQVQGVQMARTNTDNAISLVQTADSWLQKVNDMLSRMKSLAIEAGGIMSDTDKGNLQVEYEAMQDEITRITSNYNAAGKFNGLYLFRGGNGTQGYADDIVTTGGRLAEAQGPQELAVSVATDSEIIGLAGGGYIISSDNIDGKGNDGVQLYDADGSKIGAPNVSLEGINGITALKNGGFITAGGSTDQMVQRYDRYGNKIGSEINVGFAVDTVSVSQIVSFPDGDFMITNGGEISRFEADATISADQIISIIPPSGPAPSSNELKMTTFPDGEFVIADGTTIERYDANGIAMTSFTEITLSVEPESVISLKSGGFAVQMGDTVQVYNKDGAQEGEDISFTSAPETIVALDDGGFMAMMKTDSKLEALRYSSDQTLFERFQINNGNTDVADLGQVDVAILSNGDFVVEWTQDNIADQPVSYTRSYSMESGISIQVGADINQTLSLELPNLDVKNHEVIGSFEKFTYDKNNSVQTKTLTDVRWSEIIDPNKTNVSSDDILAKLDSAINYISESRASMAAQQNRLQNTKEGLLAYQDNLSSAESKIRDVDMARESTLLARNQVLSNAANAMLAQANQLPQSVLQLLG